MVKRLLLSAAFAAVLILSGGWFSANPLAVSIVGINEKDTTPVADNNAPEAGTVSLPLTIHVKATKGGVAPALTTLKIQWRNPSGGAWTDIATVLSGSTGGDKEFVLITLPGLDKLTSAQLAKGVSSLIRIYASDGTNENASTAVDTTAEGTNGWRDQWVVSFTLHATNDKPNRPTP